MYKYQTIQILILLITMSMSVKSQKTDFDLIVLGSGGGIDESNLSAYLISASQKHRYLCLDAGTLMYGLKLASEAGHFNQIVSNNSDLTLPAYVLHHHIDAYAISHPHLDHVSGMLLAAPFDKNKTIFSSGETANVLMEHIFLSPMWGNFSNEGENAIGKWDLERMEINSWYTLPENPLEMQIFSLCHSCPNESSAFLIKNKEAYCLYFGDTGADVIEGENRLENIYQTIKPLIQSNQLKAILMEVSFPNSQSNKSLYGHLKPVLLEKELEALANIIDANNPETALKGLKVMINHLKPNFQKTNNSIEIIENEIRGIHHFGAEIIFLQQSEKYTL